MLDTFEVITTTGVVLWSRSYAHVSANLLNAFVRDVFIEEKTPVTAADSSASKVSTYKREKHILKWTFAKDLGLIFVVSSSSRRSSPFFD